MEKKHPMALSKSILSFLQRLEEKGESFDPDYFKEMIWPDDPDFFQEVSLEEGPLSNEERDELRKIKQEILNMASSVVEARTHPTTSNLGSDIPVFLHRIYHITGDDPLDSYLTPFTHERIPDQVARVKELRVLYDQTKPNKKITKYFEQAAWCYVYGMYDAVAVLSRSVLEFSLEEVFSAHNIQIRPKDGGKGYLEGLIDLAGKTKVGRTSILDSELVGSAARIRETGNKAVHRNSTTEPEARNTITETVRVLTHIYSNILKSGEYDV